MNDAPPSSLMDSTMSPKVTIMQGEGVAARFLACSTSGVEGCVGDLKWGLKILISKSITHTDLHKPNNKLVSVELERFWCRNPQDSPHPNLWEATTFPLIVLFVHGHEAST